MGIAKPEDIPIVTASVREFVKLCHRNGLKPEQVIQASIVVATTAIEEEAGGDAPYAWDLVERHQKSLRSAVAVALRIRKPQN